MTITEIVDGILEAEGGYVNDPDDPGGPTNRGITMETLQEYRRKVVSVEDIKNMTEDEARNIYREKYYIWSGINTLPAKYHYHMVDCAVLHGRRTAIRWLQDAIGVKQDGYIGPITRKAAEMTIEAVVTNFIIDRRIMLMGSLVAETFSKAKYLKGWIKRALKFRLNRGEIMRMTMTDWEQDGE